MKPPNWLWFFLFATISGSLAHFPKYPSGWFWDMLRFIFSLTALWLGIAGIIGLAEYIAHLYTVRLENIQYARIAGERELLRMVQAVGVSLRDLPPPVAVILAQHLIEIEDNTWMTTWLDEINPDPNTDEYLLYPTIRDYAEGSREYNELVALSEFLIGRGLLIRRPGRRHIMKSPEALSLAYRYAMKGQGE